MTEKGALVLACASAIFFGTALVTAKLGLRTMDARAGAIVRRAFGLPLAGAALRGVAQVLARAGLALWPTPFAASLIGYAVSTAAVTAADRLRRGAPAHRPRAELGWFMATGVLNGGAVLLMYAALAAAPVSLVAPIIAGYPLVTVLLGAALLREERLNVRVISGAMLVAAAIAYLVGPAVI